MPSAYFIVRATVADPVKTRRVRCLVFARASARCDEDRSARRRAGGSGAPPIPSLHQAMYQFADQAALERGTGGEEIKRLVADFDRDWPGVTRTREVLVLAEELAGT